MNKTRLFITIILALAVGLIFGAWVSASPPVSPAEQSAGPADVEAQLGSAFSYQGRLEDGGAPANGKYDFRAELYNAATGGSKVGSTVTRSKVQVNEGLFILQLDFGQQFTGQKLWLELQVRKGSASFTKLSPRQPLTAAPYALGLQPGAVMNSSGAVGFSVNANAAENQIALYGEANQDGSVAVYGNSKDNTGVFGNSVSGRGVWGQSEGWTGVYGYSVNSAGVQALSENSIGLRAETNSGYLPAIFGISSGATGKGVQGEAYGTNGRGVYGYSPEGMGVLGSSIDGSGVYAQSTNSHGVEGHSGANGLAGVYGANAATFGYGVRGESSSWYGVSGLSTSSIAVHGISEGNGTGAAGVAGINNKENGVGVFGAANFPGAVGVYGSSAENTGVYGISTGGGKGVWGSNNSSNTNGYAGYFTGRVEVTGNLTNAGSTIRIDHPLDPENQYLSHSSVESADRMNIYNGNVTTDAQGYATVTMPEWFEALNADFRYQLTVIGQFAQAIVAQEIDGNQFIIQTDKPEVTVSWQVTGIRHDPYAEMYPVQIEEEKPADEAGLYLHPEAYGLPAETGIAAQNAPAAAEEPDAPGSERSR